MALSLTKHCFFHYTIFGNTFEHVDDHEFLGVSISHNLRWQAHCNKITKMANDTLRLLRRKLSLCYKKVKSRVYQTFVRRQLEYAAAEV